MFPECSWKTPPIHTTLWKTNDLRAQWRAQSRISAAERKRRTRRMILMGIASHDSRAVLAVQGSLRCFAPWTAAGRSEGMAVYEGKGG